MNQALLVRGHAGFKRGAIAVGDGFRRFTHRGILKEVGFQSRVHGCERHRGRPVAVVHHIKRGEEETRGVPSAPLVVAIDGTHSHVHRRSVGESQARGYVVCTGCPRGRERGPQGGEMPLKVG